MEKQTGRVNSESDEIYLVLLRKTLESWRFLLLVIGPPLLWSLFLSSPGIMRALLMAMCGIVCYGCWRLWLDEGYFRVLSKTDNSLAGAALADIWQREQLTQLTRLQRYQGAKRQLRRTLILTGVVWVIWLPQLTV